MGTSQQEIIAVLLVEGDAGDAAAIMDALEPCTCNTFSFEALHLSGLSAALAELKNRSFDILLLDTSLPGGVLESIAGVRSVNPEIPVIALSGDGDNEEGVRAVLRGAQDYLAKTELGCGQLTRSIRYAISRSRTELALAKSEAKLRAILDGIDIGVVIIDRGYFIRSANRCYCEQVNLSAGEIIGRHCYEVSHHFLKPCHELDHVCSVKSVFEGGKSSKVIHTHYDNIGEAVYVETVSLPLRDSSGNITSAIEMLMNITERLTLEKDLQLRISELEKFYDMAVGRELKMLELKDEIEQLKDGDGGK